MTLRSLRFLTAVAAVLALAIPAAAQSAPSDLTNDQGIVQSVGPTQIELRALDGTVASFAVSQTTRVRVNGQPGQLIDIRPGYVATVMHNGNQPAVLIRAFGRPALITSRGIVSALTRTSITIGSDTGLVTIPLDRATVFRFRGDPGFRWQARPGALVVVRYRDGGPAKSVNVLKRARA